MGTRTSIPQGKRGKAFRPNGLKNKERIQATLFSELTINCLKEKGNDP